MFFLFSALMMISLIPARLAANIFSFDATHRKHFAAKGDFSRHGNVGFHFSLSQGRSQRSSHRDTCRRTIFRNSPSGTWIWIFQLSKISSFRLRIEACALIYSSASIADSFITSPGLPVNVRRPPLPRLKLVSTNKISPPTAVHANPVTTPA